MSFPGLGLPEIVLIMAILLILFGPKKIPELAKSIGKALREFKKTTTEVEEFKQAVATKEWDKSMEKILDLADKLETDVSEKSQREVLEEIKKRLEEREKKG